MRFCPFCAHENADDSAQCAKCGRRLPPRRLERREGEAAPGVPRPAAPGGSGPARAAKPDLQTRPAGLVPKSPLRARAEAILAGTAPTVPTARASGDGASAPFGPRSGSPAGGASNGGSGALPLPPPPADYKGPLETPTALRDATGKAQRLDPAELDSNAFEAVSSPPPVPGDGAGNGEPNRALTRAETHTPLVRAREAAGRGWQAVRRGVDVQAARYVFQLARDTVKKKAEINRLRKLIVSEQQKLDALLGQLGQRARAADLGLPAMADEMRTVKMLESDSEAARGHVAEIEAQRAAAEEQFCTLQTEQQAAIGEADAAVQKLAEELAAGTSERAGHRAGMNRLDAQLKSLGRQVQAKEAAALKATDPHEQGTLRGESEALRVQIAALEPERAKFEQRAGELDAPVAELEERLTQAREDASRLRRDLGEAARAHKDLVAQYIAQIDAEGRRVAGNDRELSLKFVTLGTILNLNRVSGPDLDPLYEAFDGCKAAIAEHEENIALLEAQMQGYDRQKLRKGAIVLGVGLLVLLFMVSLIAR